ncbi:uncharacterized protein LOC127415946 isoform X2 [Myxocyprinus asiaticus]|uniref:uncharacterized protein LOC127415946 isoform X2 n=1 Tax=Myxocyprinus asiaticus TaxID=70543 RepID=UPI0022214EA6|nr:uncharacterized protein LOC127415946 isoform X2 [Myxocyprinus asiaticus]
MSANLSNADQFKRNDDEFRNTMEALFQKYSSLNDPGIEVCLKTMTCRTERGPVPIDSAEGEGELEALKTRLKDHSMREFVDQNDDDQMDVSGITEDDLNGSDQQNNENLWHGESFQLSMNLTNSSHSSLWGVPSQPEEEDEELEKTLSSHGSTLLDVYPSMLNQIGEAYRRQHMKDTARGVLQKYRHKRWQASQAHPRNTSFKKRHNGTLNKTTEISFTKKSPAQWNISCSMKGSIKLQDMFKNKLKSSPLKSSSYEASGCFYSPRRDRVDESFESPQTNLLLDRKPKQNSVRVIDFTTPPYSVSPLSDQSPDLNQTYNIGPTVLSTSHAVPGSLVSISPRPAWRSPGRPAKALSLVNQRGMSITSQPSNQQPAFSSLDKNGFREHLHSPVSSPKRGLISCFSPSGKNTFRSTLLRDESHQSKPTEIHSPKRRSPIRYLPQSEVHRSPYGGKREQLSSTQRPLYHNTDHRESFSMSEKSQISPRLNKCQCSLSGSQSTSLSKYDSFREPQIDAEFRKLYHHFICRGTSSPCPTTHCHLCERQLKEMSQSPSSSSSSMSTLALTPLRATFKKRRHQPDVDGSFRFKRFRESRSPLKHLQILPYQLKDRYTSSAMSEPSEDKHAWDRAVLLQCPSPWFLRGTGNLRKIREAKLAMQMNPCAMSWRNVTSGVHAAEVCEVHQSLLQQSTLTT